MDRYYAFFSQAQGYKTIESARYYNLKDFNHTTSIITFDVVLARFIDEYLIWHQSGTAKLCEAMAAHMGLNIKTRRLVVQAALVHDVGKLFIPPEILTKNDELNYEEMALMRNHSACGAEFLNEQGFVFEVVEKVRFHHERYDGDGYPGGCKGLAIPLESRIIAICDAVDAMISGRHYKLPLSVEGIKKELCNCAGRQFDPYLVEVALSFLNTKKESVVHV